MESRASERALAFRAKRSGSGATGAQRMSRLAGDRWLGVSRLEHLRHGAVHADYSGGHFETLDLGQAGHRIARVPEDKPPVTCLYCGKTIGPSESAVIVTKTSLDESGEPDFTSHSVEGIAHPECWERERPEGREA
jgi:hypothetical protein